jgi:hypothetical protein
MNTIFRKSSHLVFCFIAAFSVHSANLAADEPELGETVCSTYESYTVKKQLGEGFFGKVFQVENSQGQTFAMKWFKTQDIDLNEAMGLLGDAQREYERGQMFSHPNIIKSVELFSDTAGENHYLVLEYVDGKTLSWTPRKSLSPHASLTVSTQILNTLQYALEEGYIYLDLHEGNLMIDGQSDLKMIDLAGFFSWKELYDWFYPNQRLESTNQASSKKAKILNRVFREQPEMERKLRLSLKQHITGKYDQLIKYYIPNYFESLTEMIRHILSKSDLQRNEKVYLYGEVKKIAWGYSEDAADGSPDTHTEYFESLETVLKSKI